MRATTRATTLKMVLSLLCPSPPPTQSASAGLVLYGSGWAAAMGASFQATAPFTISILARPDTPGVSFTSLWAFTQSGSICYGGSSTGGGTSPSYSPPSFDSSPPYVPQCYPFLALAQPGTGANFGFIAKKDSGPSPNVLGAVRRFTRFRPLRP